MQPNIPVKQRPSDSAHTPLSDFGLRFSAFFRISDFGLRTSRRLLSCLILAFTAILSAAAAGPAPVKIIFDTDVGNDVDDALALSVLHALQSRGECELLAVTITKPDELAGPFVDAMNTFYGRPGIPIGYTHAKLVNDPSKFLLLADAKDGEQARYPHRLKRSSDAPEATALLRKILSQQPDHSLVLVQVGYFSNFAVLLDTPGDAESPLAGRELVQQKVKLLSVMAGSFKTTGHDLEYNVTQDLPATKKLAKNWPTPVVWSGFEIGIAVPYPALSIERDFGYVPHHPATEAYCLYNPPPHERPTWDLTSALYAVRPDRSYFGLSSPGRVTVEEDGFTRFTPAPEGRDRFLMLNDVQVARVKEALVELASQPPCR
jgi:hypothetical protein